jgi:hypothetical protein
MKIGDGSNIVADAKQVEVLDFGKRDYNAYKRMLANIEKGFVKASEDYVLIACNLWQINHDEYFRIDSFKSIADFALEKFEMKKATVYNYIKVIDKFGEVIDGKALGLKEQFKLFKCSQLINMLSFTPEQLEAVDPAWSVRRIIEFGKSPLLDTQGNAEDPDEGSMVDSETPDENGNAQMYMTIPEINDGRTHLFEFTNADDIEKRMSDIRSAFNNMKNDKDFKNKNVRLVIELAYD